MSEADKWILIGQVIWKILWNFWPAVAFVVGVWVWVEIRAAVVLRKARRSRQGVLPILRRMK